MESVDVETWIIHSPQFLYTTTFHTPMPYRDSILGWIWWLDVRNLTTKEVVFD